MQAKLECFKSAVAFFFLFFLHETSIGNSQQGISYNIMFTQPLAPIRPIGRIYETNINKMEK